MPSTSKRASELIDQRVPFVQATVVRAQCPTSARPGDSALVSADGSIEGFVGGQCAEGSVRTAALDVLENGEPLLLRVLPSDDDASFPDTPGARRVVNPCLSGGALEIFLEPRLPAPTLVVAGNTPIASALTVLAKPLGFDVVSDGSVAGVAGAVAVIVASHGRGEEDTMRAALDAGVGLVGLVASRTRGADVVASLDLSDEERSRVRSPVGDDIGARTAEEIALSIMTELVRAVRREGLTAPEQVEADVVRPVDAIDPVCGMTVIVNADTPHLNFDGTDLYYCNVGCRTRHAEELGTVS